MKVTCGITALAQIEDGKLRQHVSENVHLEEINLVRGQQYDVIGILFRCGVPWFYICEDVISDYPKPYCAAFFSFDDLTVPAGWVLEWEGRLSSLLPRWWADEPHFLERLIDGDEEARVIWLRAQAGPAADPADQS